MERENAWKTYDDQAIDKMNQLTDDYIDFISECKTERECTARAIQMAKAQGYVSLDEARKAGTKLAAGSKVYASIYGKTLILVQVGEQPLEQGFNILGAHIDSPRMDIKQNPCTNPTTWPIWTPIITVALRSTSGSPCRWPFTAWWRAPMAAWCR